MILHFFFSVVVFLLYLLLSFFSAVKNAAPKWVGNLGKNKQMAGGPHTFAHRETNLFVLASAIRA